jgi:hypothetical protein
MKKSGIHGARYKTQKYITTSASWKSPVTSYPLGEVEVYE